MNEIGWRRNLIDFVIKKTWKWDSLSKLYTSHKVFTYIFSSKESMQKNKEIVQTKRIKPSRNYHGILFYSIVIDEIES